MQRRRQARLPSEEGELPQEAQPKPWQWCRSAEWLAGSRRAAREAGLAVSRKIQLAWAASIDGDFLRGDTRRTFRPYILMQMGLLHTGRVIALTLPQESLGPTLAMVLIALLLAVSVAAKRSPDSLRWDVAISAIAFLFVLQGNFAIERSPEQSPEEKAMDVVACFSIMLQMLLSAGTHIGCVFVWVIAASTTQRDYFHSDPLSCRLVVMMGTVLLALHVGLHCTEVAKYEELKAAREQTLRLSALEQEAAQEREERITMCLGMVLHHLKAPLLLLKSDLSVCSPKPAEAAQALEAVRSRVRQLWSTFTGLQTSIREELGEDSDALSRCFDERDRAALRPEHVSLEAPAEEARASSPVDARRAEPQGVEERRREAQRAREAPSAAVQPATSPGPPPQQAWPRAPSSSSSSSSVPSSAGRPPQQRRPRRPLKGLRGVDVGFEMMHPRLRVSMLVFHFEPEYLGEQCPGIFDLFPRNTEDFLRQLQSQLNYSAWEGEEPEEDRLTSAAQTLGRTTLALPPLRPLMELLLQLLALMDERSSCRPLVTCKGLLSDQLPDVEDDGEDEQHVAVVGLSHFG